jgi:multisubunit Na+/H+ antiporter MnhE subunit
VSHSTIWKRRTIGGGLLGAALLGGFFSLAVLIGADTYPELGVEGADPFFLKHAILVLLSFGLYSGATIGGLTTDPRCEHPEFKNHPPKVRTWIIVELIRYCATVLGELASSWELMLSWVMVAWIAVVCMYMLRTVGLWKEVALPLLIGASFIIAPLISTWSLVRWLRQEKKRMILKLMAWMLLALFVATFCVAWIVLLSDNPGRWCEFVTGSED